MEAAVIQVRNGKGLDLAVAVCKKQANTANVWKVMAMGFANHSCVCLCVCVWVAGVKVDSKIFVLNNWKNRMDVYEIGKLTREVTWGWGISGMRF